MKRLLFLLLLFPSLSWGQGTMVARSNPYVLGAGTVAAGATYLLQETFDGASACGDGSHTNCDLTWSYWNAWPDFNDTTTSLQGTNSVKFTATASEIYHTFTASDTVWASIIIYDGDVSGEIFSIRDSSDNALCKMWAYGYGANSIVVTNAGGTERSSANSAFATNTKIYLKMKLVKGTGANAECQGWYSSNGSSWTAITASTDGTWTAQASKIYIKGKDSTNNYRDDIRVDNEDINY